VPAEAASTEIELSGASRIAVIGGGPAGSFSALFLLRLAALSGFEPGVEIFEPRSFDLGGPAGCNHCGGIVSESLVQTLAAEGINLPPSVVQRGIESYQLHMDQGSVALRSPVAEQRIAAVYRGNGPRGGERMPWDSFDGFLQGLAVDRGARVVHELVLGIQWQGGMPYLRLADEVRGPYDLVVVASGVNSNLETAPDGAQPRTAVTARTYICELHSDEDTIRERVGNSMHVFMLDEKGVEFAALIPKGDYITFAVLGHGIDAALIQRFLAREPVRRALPFDWIPTVCSCLPLINVKGPSKPFGERIVMVGDSGVTRLYKDGIGAAYRTAKAAATTAVLYGVSSAAFETHYLPACRSIARDNRYGRFLFGVTWLFRKIPFLRRTVLRMTRAEQRSKAGTGPMSIVLWNLFTGSAPYRAVFWTAMRPSFLVRFARHLIMSFLPRRTKTEEVDRHEATV